MEEAKLLSALLHELASPQICINRFFVLSALELPRSLKNSKRVRSTLKPDTIVISQICIRMHMIHTSVHTPAHISVNSLELHSMHVYTLRVKPEARTELIFLVHVMLTPIRGNTHWQLLTFFAIEVLFRVWLIANLHTTNVYKLRQKLQRYATPMTLRSQ